MKKNENKIKCEFEDCENTKAKNGGFWITLILESDGEKGEKYFCDPRHFVLFIEAYKSFIIDEVMEGNIQNAI